MRLWTYNFNQSSTGPDGKREGRVPDHSPERDQDPAIVASREHCQPGILLKLFIANNVGHFYPRDILITAGALLPLTGPLFFRERLF